MVGVQVRVVVDFEMSGGEGGGYLEGLLVLDQGREKRYKRGEKYLLPHSIFHRGLARHGG
jgi:hypothetical protein